MAIDPLSSATRSAKRSLLIAGTLAITYRAFDISIDKIPFSGVTISFDPGVFAFLLTVALTYFTAAFAFYYYIDIRNIEPTAHEQGFKKVYYDGVGLYSRRYASQIQKEIRAILPPKHHLTGKDDVHHILEGAAKASFFEMLGNQFIVDVSDTRIFKATDEKNTSTHVDISPHNNPELFEQIAAIVRTHLRGFWWRSRLNKLRYQRLKWTVAAVYPLRNYILDGLVPLLVASLAFAALYRIVDLQWLRTIAPSS